MPERDGYIAGVPCWVDSSQPDPAAAIDFYHRLFGWEFENVMPADSPGPYFVARLRGGDVAAVVPAADGAASATWNTYVAVDDADATAAKVFDSGGKVISEAFDAADAGRMAELSDAEGAPFRIWQAKQHKGAAIVNEPGAVVFNGLATHDVETAKKFYGAVFGWDTLTLDGGFLAWTLAGYGEHLEKDDPGLRARTVEMGVPERFADVVGSLQATPADQPVGWSVTFAVEDADAAAAKAVELGATIVVPPMDAPWVRMSVISDPQGAMFVASQFVPENRDVPATASDLAAA